MISPDQDIDGWKKTPPSLPHGVEMEVSAKDLLYRLLDVDPVKRLHSLRTLKNIAFYKGYSFADVYNKKVRPRDFYPSDALKVNSDIDNFNAELIRF